MPNLKKSVDPDFYLLNFTGKKLNLQNLLN